MPFDQIVDARNTAPVLRLHRVLPPTPYVSIGEVDVLLPEALTPQVWLPAFPDGPEIERLALQEYRFTIFGEKSSLEAVLAPIAAEYGADLFLPTGETSETMIYALAKAAAQDGRRMIVFYVSDCDPAGWQMAVSVSRKLQAFRDLEFPRLEFELHPIALTPDQVRKYNLPSTPLKATELRALAWQKKMGVQQTEIDALATLRPNLLRQIVTGALDAYYDHTLDARVRVARDEWQQEAQQALEDQLGEDVLERMRAEAEAKIGQAEALVAEVNDTLRVDVDDSDLPEFDVPHCDPGSGLPNPLIDSDEDYVTATRRLIDHKAYEA